MSKKRYSAAEKQAWHNKQAKKGARNKDGKLLSDFARGYHKAKADFICEKRQDAAVKHHICHF